MTAIRTSQNGLLAIIAREGMKYRAYRDGGGVPTIGAGHTRGVQMGDTCTYEQAMDWLREDVAEAEATIRAHLPDEIERELPQDAWDALVSFVFNLGPQAFRNPRTRSPTGLARALLARNYSEVPRQMKRWIFDNGERVTGLVNRRESEAAQWRRGWEKGVAA